MKQRRFYGFWKSVQQFLDYKKTTGPSRHKLSWSFQLYTIERVNDWMNDISVLKILFTKGAVICIQAKLKFNYILESFKSKAIQIIWIELIQVIVNTKLLSCHIKVKK